MRGPCDASASSVINGLVREPDSEQAGCAILRKPANNGLDRIDYGWMKQPAATTHSHEASFHKPNHLRGWSASDDGPLR